MLVPKVALLGENLILNHQAKGQLNSLMNTEVLSQPQTSSSHKDIVLENLIPQIAKGAGITFLGDFLGKGVNFLSQIVIARLLGTEIFGLYALGLVIFNVAQTLSVMGLSQGALRYVSIYHGEAKTSYVKGTIIHSLGLPFLVGSIIGVILFFGSDVLARAFGQPELNHIIKVIALGIPFMAAMMVSIAVTRGFKKMQYFVFVKSLFHPILNLALVFLFYWLGFRLLGAISAWVLAAALGLLLSLYFIKKEFPKFFQVEAAFNTKELVKFSAPLMMVGFLQMMFMKTDILMLGYFRSSAEVGIYNAVSQIMIPLAMVLMAFNSIFSPFVADYYNQRLMRELNNLLKIVAKWILLLTMPIFIIIILSPKEILNFFGPEFTSGWQALLILAIFYFLSVSFGPVTETLIMTGNQYIEFANITGSLVLNIILNFLLIPNFGIEGAALATGISVFSLHIARFVEVKYLLKVSPLSTKYLKGLIPGISISGMVFFLKALVTNSNYMGSLILTSVLVCGLYIGIIFLLQLDSEDKLILNIAKKRMAAIWA